MIISLTLILILVTIIGWGFGDFFIQKSIRKLGDWETLFVVTFVGAIVLFPFVYKYFSFLYGKTFFILLIASIILFVAALLDFEALRVGKLAIVEPLWSLEIIASSILAFFIIKESLKLGQILLMVGLIAGLVLVSLKDYTLKKKVWLEKGVLLAILSAIVMGCANFFIGFGARESNGLMMNWFLNIFMAIVCLIYILFKKKFRKMVRDVKNNKKSILGMCIFDNAAWIAFAIAMTLAPIGITVALTESYIVIAVLLGVFVNKERLRSSQKVGIFIAIISAIALAYTIG